MEEEIINISYDNMTSGRNSDYHNYENFFFLTYVCINMDMYMCVYFFTYFFFFSFLSYSFTVQYKMYKSSKPYILIFKLQDNKRGVWFS